MIVGMQQDAHEFLLKLIENLVQTWSKKTPKGKPKHGWRHYDCNELGKVFKGTLVNTIKCSTCTSEYSSVFPFYELNLIWDKELLSDETLDGNNQYKCENWDMMSDAIKTSKIDTAPPVLIVSLNRFNSYGLKLKKHFDYPMQLDLTSHFNKKGKRKLVYELTALVIHEGRFSFRGHYFSYVRAFNKQWYKFDDSNVTLVSDESQVMSSCPYILFYRMKPESRKEYLNHELWEHILSDSDSSVPKPVEKTKPKPRRGKKPPAKDTKSKIKIGDSVGNSRKRKREHSNGEDRKIIKTIIDLPYVDSDTSV